MVRDTHKHTWQVVKFCGELMSQKSFKEAKIIRQGVPSV